MKQFAVHWITTAVALGVTAWVLPGVEVSSLAALLVAASRARLRERRHQAAAAAPDAAAHAG